MIAGHGAAALVNAEVLQDAFEWGLEREGSWASGSLQFRNLVVADVPEV